MFPTLKKYLDDPDVALMLKCQKGDKLAFEQLLDKYKSAVINTIYRFIGDKIEAEDLSQEVFLKIYNSRKSYKPSAKFKTWLFRITVNLCLNQIRDRKKYTRQTVYLDQAIEDEEGTHPKEFEDTRQETPSDSLLKQELEAVVRRAVNALPQNQKMVVILSRYQELSYEEIAKTMRCSVLSVKSLLFRAKENLRESLEDYV